MEVAWMEMQYFVKYNKNHFLITNTQYWFPLQKLLRHYWDYSIIQLKFPDVIAKDKYWSSFTFFCVNIFNRNSFENPIFSTKRAIFLERTMETCSCNLGPSSCYFYSLAITTTSTAFMEGVRLRQKPQVQPETFGVHRRNEWSEHLSPHEWTTKFYCVCNSATKLQTANYAQNHSSVREWR